MATATLPRVPSWVDAWVGIPFRARGRTAAGLDCYGIIRELYRDRFGVVLPMWDDYDDVRDQERLRGIIADALPRFARVDAPTEGDVVLFRLRGYLCHVGAVVADPWFLHALESTRGSVVDRLDSLAWSRRIEGFYRWAG